MFVLHVAALRIWMLNAWQLVEWREEIVERRWWFVSLKGAPALLVLAMVMRLLAQSGERGCRFRRKEVLPREMATTVTRSCHELVWTTSFLFMPSQ